MPKFFIKTYGCQMNERDSEQVAHSLLQRGYKRALHEADADVVLLNTCSVRDMADQKALGKMGMLGHIAKVRPHVVFGFLGCMAQARGASLLKNLPHVDLDRSLDCSDWVLHCQFSFGKHQTSIIDTTRRLFVRR